MKVLLDIKDAKADFVLELLGNFGFVNIESILVPKSSIYNEFTQTIEDVNLAKEGKLKLKTAEQLLDEL